MLEELKDELDFESFFKAMGVEKIKHNRDGYSMRCLHPDHNDSGPSFHYKTTTHKFFCYGCHFRGDVIDIVQQVKDLTFRKSISWLKEFGGWSSTTTTKQLEAIIERREEKKHGGLDDASADPNVVIPAYHETDFSTARDSIRGYLKRRQWSEDLLGDYDIGYCKHGYFGDRIIFPVYDRDHRLTTFAARATWNVGEGEERYLYPRDSLLSKSIWPIHKPLDGPPIFLEGCPDALRLREYGYNAYACLGNQLGDVKLALIRDAFRNHKKIIILPDNDKGGDILFQAFGNLIHQFEIDVCRMKSIYFDGELLKDIDEVGQHYGREKVEEVISNVVSYQDALISKKYKFPPAPKMVTTLVKDEIDDNNEPKPSGKFDIINQLYWSAR